MALKKTLSLLLALTLALSVLSPCGALLPVRAATPLYGEAKLEQVTEPVIGNSYYLAANVAGTMYYFRHGTVTDTVPYSLVTTDNINHNWAFKLTVESSMETSEKFEGGFQMTYTHPTSKVTSRIYCYDVLRDSATVTGQTGVMDTGANSGVAYKNRHSFFVDEVNGVKVLRQWGNRNVLVVKQLDQTVSGKTVKAWRMLGVPEAELANEGVYPAMLLDVHTHSYGTDYQHDENGHWHMCGCGDVTESEPHNYVMDETLGYGVCVCGADLSNHECENTDGQWHQSEQTHYQICGACEEKMNEAAHTYGQWIFNTENGTQDRACTVCGYKETLYGTGNKVTPVKAPVIGQSYYLAANVAGKMYYFRHGTVTDTVPYSLVTTDNINHNWAFKLTVESSMETSEKFEGGFQLVYANPSTGTNSRIYCYDVKVDGDNRGVMDTGVNSGVAYKNRHSFFVDEVNGVKVLRKYGNDNILVVKYNSTVKAWRMLGVPEAELANEGVYPAMLVNAHTHSYDTEYRFDENGHWHLCDCGAATESERHNYVWDAALGYGICVCGATLKDHECENSDGQWNQSEQGHYQLCSICGEKIGEAAHTYGQWVFNTENGTQSKACTVCGYKETLYGIGSKVIPVEAPAIGQSYYLAANVAGTIYYFRHGAVTDTAPYSLVTTDDVNHNWAFQLTLESSMETSEKFEGGFQMTYTHPTSGVTSRIYCYDVLRDSATVTGQTGVMDTGANSGVAYKNRHSFFMDEVNGVKVLRQWGNRNVLVVKYNSTVKAWRMLGVPEAELANEGVYPAMLVNAHTHSHTDTTYHSDALGHWFTCECGGKSDYADHTVTNWKTTAAPTQTIPGSKTGVCTVCGATAVAEIPPVVAEGYYYLTGTVNGVKYYFREKTGKESVEDTVPFSLLTTDQKKNAMQVNILWNEKENTYTISYFTTRQLNLYMGDVNGSTVKKDGKIDLASSATTAKDLIAFHWDPQGGVFYQMEGGVKYVIAFQQMTQTDGKTQAVRMLAVPESELGKDMVAMKLELIHEHSYAAKWSYNAINHWQECDCGTKKNEGAHSIDRWTVEKEATNTSAGRKSGVCSLCGEKIVQAIPMLTDNVKAPANGSQYYLTGVLNGRRYYFRHAPAGTSVTDTTPYALSTLVAGKSNILTIKVADGKYNLVYGKSNYHIYMNGNGVGVTSSSTNKDLVDFLWDEENKLLYQVENGVKCVLVFQVMKNNKTGGSEVRITYMPMNQALVDPTVAIARFTQNAPPEDTNKKPTQGVPELPEGATPLKTISQEEPPAVELPQDDAISPSNLNGQTDGQNTLLKAVIVCLVILAVIVLLILLKNTKFGLWFFRKWNLWTAVSFVIAAAVLMAGMLLPGANKEKAPSLADFTIVANAGNLDVARELAVTIYETHGVSLPVVQSKDYEGNMGIYLDTQGQNSYGGYKYSVYSEDNEYGQGIYINGSGASLETAISKWLKTVKDAASFPFGLQERISGYEWNTEDVNMTGLGFTLKDSESRELSEGVELRKLSYESFGYGKVSGYAVIVASDANVEMKVAAGKWDENTTTENPGTRYTVEQYGNMLTEDGYEVLAIANAGFFDLNTTMTYIPWGLQVVDGYVTHKPSEDNPNNTNNWFAQTADGKYVISNTAGYYETYETTLAQGVGGGRVLMKDGKPCFSATVTDFRTVVGITKDGDLIILTMPSANYAFVTQIFMDMDMDVENILNLDGGGSTTLHSLNESGDLTRLVCETPLEREVADAIAIVKKK